LLKNPEKAAFPSVAFKLAAWYWRENAYVIKSNEKASKGDLSELVDGTYLKFSLLTHSLSNNLQQLKWRAELYEKCLDELTVKVPTMKRGQGIECEIGNEKGYSAPFCFENSAKSNCGCEGEIDMRSCPYGFNTDNRYLTSRVQSNSL
jgi:hypothetical protein